MEGHGGKKRSLHHYFPSQTKKKKSNENEEVQGKELTVSRSLDYIHCCFGKICFQRTLAENYH